MASHLTFLTAHLSLKVPEARITIPSNAKVYDGTNFVAQDDLGVAATFLSPEPHIALRAHPSPLTKILVDFQDLAPTPEPPGSTGWFILVRVDLDLFFVELRHAV